MEGRRDRGTEGRREAGKRDRESERWKDGGTVGQRDRETERQRDGGTEGQRDRWTDRRTHGEMEGRREGRTADEPRNAIRVGLWLHSMLLRDAVQTLAMMSAARISAVAHSA